MEINNIKFLLAVINGKIEDVKNHLSLGVDVNFFDKNSEMTALHFAVQNAQKDIVKLLLNQQNIRKTIKNGDGKTAQEVAIDNNFDGILKLFDKYTEPRLISDPQPGTSRLEHSDLISKMKRKNDNDQEVRQEKKLKSSNTSPQGIDCCKINFLDGMELKSGGLKSSLHGSIYQLKVLMLFFWRATERGYASFRLATEHPDAEKFDDVIFQYRHNRKEMLRLVQAKHKDKADNIPDKEFVSLDANKDFCTGKYFHSFLKIRQKCTIDSYYSAFSESEIEDVILLTNTGIERETASLYFEEISLKLDNILSFEEKLGLSQPKAFKIKNSEIFKTIFEEMSDYNLLIQQIAASVIKNEKIDFTGVFKEYFYPLMTYLFKFVPKEDCLQFQSYQTCTNEASEIKRAAFEIMEKNQTKKMKFDRDDPASIKIKISGGWKEQFLPVNCVTIQDCPRFVKIFKTIVENCEDKKVNIDSKTVPKNELVAFRHNIKSLAGYVLVYDGNGKIRFSTHFLRGGTLPSNLEIFRSKLRTIFSNEFEKFYEYEFKIKLWGFKTCEENSFIRKT